MPPSWLCHCFESFDKITELILLKIRVPQVLPTRFFYDLFFGYTILNIENFEKKLT